MTAQAWQSHPVNVLHNGEVVRWFETCEKAAAYAQAKSILTEGEWAVEDSRGRRTIPKQTPNAPNTWRAA